LWSSVRNTKALDAFSKLAAAAEVDPFLAGSFLKRNPPQIRQQSSHRILICRQELCCYFLFQITSSKLARRSRSEGWGFLASLVKRIVLHRLSERTPSFLWADFVFAAHNTSGGNFFESELLGRRIKAAAVALSAVVAGPQSECLHSSQSMSRLPQTGQNALYPILSVSHIIEISLSQCEHFSVTMKVLSFLLMFFIILPNR